MKQNIFLSFPEFEFTRQELAEWNGYKHWCDIIVTLNEYVNKGIVIITGRKLTPKGRYTLLFKRVGVIDNKQFI
jgi:hypothetical protein